MRTTEIKQDALREAGYLVLPVGGPCPDFDYTGPGCPGHLIDKVD